MVRASSAHRSLNDGDAVQGRRGGEQAAEGGAGAAGHALPEGVRVRRQVQRPHLHRGGASLLAPWSVMSSNNLCQGSQTMADAHQMISWSAGLAASPSQGACSRRSVCGD